MLTGMKVSCVWNVGLALAAFSTGAGGAHALNAPQKLHHSRTTEPHLTETHRTAGHRLVGSPSPTSRTGGHTIHTGATRTGAPLRRASLPVHHPYYDRFTASSIVDGPVGEGDI